MDEEKKESYPQDFEIIPYDKPDGSIPVYEFLEGLPQKLRVRAHRDILLLGEYGNDSQGKWTKSLGDGIFEVRTKQSSNVTRVLYFFMVGKKIILTHGFVKKTQKTPSSEIELAKKYRTDYLSREEKK